MSTKKLSNAQRRVMKWLGYGWEGQPGPGSSIMVNGQRICNIDTITALQNAGLVEQDDSHCWKATKEGQELTGRLCL